MTNVEGEDHSVRFPARRLRSALQVTVLEISWWHPFHHFDRENWRWRRRVEAAEAAVLPANPPAPQKKPLKCKKGFKKKKIHGKAKCVKVKKKKGKHH